MQLPFLAQMRMRMQRGGAWNVEPDVQSAVQQKQLNPKDGIQENAIRSGHARRSENLVGHEKMKRPKHGGKRRNGLAGQAAGLQRSKRLAKRNDVTGDGRESGNLKAPRNHVQNGPSRRIATRPTKKNAVLAGRSDVFAPTKIARRHPGIDPISLPWMTISMLAMELTESTALALLRRLQWVTGHICLADPTRQAVGSTLSTRILRNHHR